LTESVEILTHDNIVILINVYECGHVDML
jgi:hypothetical protein